MLLLSLLALNYSVPNLAAEDSTSVPTPPAPATVLAPVATPAGDTTASVKPSPRTVKKSVEHPVAPDAPGTVPIVDAGAPSAPIRTLRFDTDLGVGADAMLEGVEASRTIRFSMPRAWSLQDDPVLTLGFDHSASLISSRSSLTVRLNDRAVGSVALDPSNTSDGVLQVRLPRALLQDYNELQLTAMQHVSGPCEDPYDPSLWTRVRSDSHIDVAYSVTPPVADLGAFPLPFVDVLDPERARIALVGTATPDRDTLRALGRIGVMLGRTAGYRSIDVAPPASGFDDLETHGLLVGIVGRDPLLTATVQAAHPEPLSAGTGFVAVVPVMHDPKHLVLLVAGADAAGLKLATDALIGQDRAPVLSGTSVVITRAPAPTPPPNHDAFRPAPSAADFTLADVGLTDRTVRGLYTEPVTIPLELEGDALPSADGELLLHYAHSEPVDARVSTVEVRLNGVVLRSHALDSGDAPGTLRVVLPRTVVAVRNTLEIAFHLVPLAHDVCRETGFRQLWATVLADSALTLPRDHWAMMPDLSRLSSAFWPFSVDPAGGGTAIVLPAQPTLGEVSGALQLAAALGRSSVASDPALELTTADAVPEKRSLVLLSESGHAHATLDPLLTSGVFGLTGAGIEDTVEEAVNPADPAHALLVIRGVDVARAVRAVTDLDRVGQLSGNAALLPQDARPRLFDVGPQTAMGSRPARTAVAELLAKRWSTLGAALVGAALLAAYAIRRWARARGGTT